MVFGEGNIDAQVMFIGEAPGRAENVSGRPFVGRSGKLLRAMIQAIDLSDKCFIANICRCLKYNSLVQLGDGSWKEIGKLVREKYDGYVRCIDSNGFIMQRKVIGWHKTPLKNRSLYKLTYKSARKASNSIYNTTLTEDHPVLTPRGYIPVSELKNGEKIFTGQGFSKTVLDILYGSLLGDGHIKSNTALFSLGHSIKQEDYFLFKISELEKDLKCTIYRRDVKSSNNKFYPSITCVTRAHRGLHRCRDPCIPVSP